MAAVSSTSTRTLRFYRAQPQAPRRSARFTAALGDADAELSLELKLVEQRGQLAVALFDASHFELHKTLISTPQQIREITGGFFDSPAILYDSIRLLLAENSPSGRVKFIEHHSSLVCKLPLVAMPWTIPMERVEPKADVRNDLLENQVKQLSARVKFLEHLIRAPAKVEGPRFEDVSVPDFTLSADRKTASRHVGNGNGGWHGFLSKQSLAAMGNKFTVKLTPNGEDLSVGVALRNADPYDGFNNTEGCWMLQLGAGPSCCFCSNGNNGTEFSTQTEIVDGSRLSVRLDPLNKLLYFSINGSVLHIADIPEPFGDLYAAVDLQAAGQSVSFL